MTIDKVTEGKGPTRAEMAKMLREVRDVAGPAHDEAICHYGLVAREKCRRCSIIDRAGKMLDQIAATHPEWLR